ncbi:YheC/YheD family protein [Metabacillus arenae]|uniref:YheC/YheD family protein n=1 Tax=Metabacillus arenae TaxID=2771434 RepID=A0A926RZF3_9BACI|nr:YheC/YheD family protein [Metabacillus arenae]MBD1383056.1 YheC/YheD family protein [Metabacillus arenae]
MFLKEARSIDKEKSDHPHIGICVSKAKRRLRKLVKQRLQQYPDDATIITFYIEDVDLVKHNVRGTCLEKRAGEISRSKGIFPFPDVIYMQCDLDHKMLKEFEQVIGHKVFNSFIFDKWKGWHLLANDKVLCHHLPDTRKLESEIDLQQFLYDYEDIFLKPINPIYAHNSKGIVRVKLQREGGIEVTYRQKGLRRKSFEFYEEFQDWISPKYFKDYIVQQSIATIKWGKKVTDIRLNMNKNGKGEWEVTLLLFRIASNDSHSMPGILAAHPFSNLPKMYPQNKNMENIEISVVNLGFKICHVLDKSEHHMADLGIDLGVDENGHLWIFEVNPLPYPLRGVDDLSMTRPLEYASYLALTNQQEQEKEKE